MNKKQLIFLFLSFLVGIFSIPAFAETTEGKQAKESKPDMSAIRVDMSKDELYKVYPQSYQMQYLQDKNREMIVFNDWLTPDPKDTISFYLKDGKVKWWDKEKFSASPEERLEAVLERAKHADSTTIGIQQGRPIMEMKQGDRMDANERSTEQKYLKSKAIKQ